MTTISTPDLKSLDRLVGTWQVSGDATGQVRYEWTQGRFYLMQDFGLVHGGRALRGIERNFRGRRRRPDRGLAVARRRATFWAPLQVKEKS